ncbi:MAG TPA: hypothetical protein VGG19_08480 [Tepidisphaeraceae bacterium]|jgi:hypothetical protein
MQQEMTGQWEELVVRPEFRGHRVKITIIDERPFEAHSDSWLESLREMARNGLQVHHPIDDSREHIYEDR